MLLFVTQRIHPTDDMSNPPPLPAKYRFGDFEVDLDANALTHRGYKVRLQEQPFRLLTLLVSRPGEIVTGEEIQSHLWPATPLSSSTRAFALPSANCARRCMTPQKNLSI